jgi:hypothetical protein
VHRAARVVEASFVVVADTPIEPLINRSAATAAALVVEVLGVPDDDRCALVVVVVVAVATTTVGLSCRPFSCVTHHAVDDANDPPRLLRLTSSPLPLLKASSLS